MMTPTLEPAQGLTGSIAQLIAQHEGAEVHYWGASVSQLWLSGSSAMCLLEKILIFSSDVQYLLRKKYFLW